ncbi:MAG: pilus assembly protein [Rhodobacteraceae bacterium]|nr:pilus assembly protein [Paracoccaceae bacterium]
MPLLDLIRPALRKFRDDDSANPTVEFVILIPVVMWIVFSVLESGWLLTQQTMLNRGINMAVRDLRIGIDPNPTHDSVKTDICRYATILRDCDSALQLELVENTSPISSATARCIDRASEIEPVVDWAPNPGPPVIMVLRACFVVDPLIPGAGLGALLPKDSTGGYNLVSYSAFLNEPS